MSIIDLRHNDCLIEMESIVDNSIDLCVTSPPYDNLRTYNGNLEWCFDSIAKQIVRIIADGGVIVWVVGDATINGSETGSSFKQALRFMELGLNLHDTMIYMKDGIAFPMHTRYNQCFEYMFVLSKGKPRTINIIKDRKNLSYGRKVTGTERQSDGTTKKAACHGASIKEYGSRWNVWQISTDKGNVKYDHPAKFPISLAKDHIESWSKKGDVVIDPFMGSGTTGVACVNTGRNFVGMEKDPDYFQIAKKRIEDAKENHGN